MRPIQTLLSRLQMKATEACPPCGDTPLYTSQTPSGKVCYCLGGGDPGKDNGDKEPWDRAGPLCDLTALDDVRNYSAEQATYSC